MWSLSALLQTHRSGQAEQTPAQAPLKRLRVLILGGGPGVGVLACRQLVSQQQAAARCDSADASEGADKCDLEVVVLDLYE